MLILIQIQFAKCEFSFSLHVCLTEKIEFSSSSSSLLLLFFSVNFSGICLITLFSSFQMFTNLLLSIHVSSSRKKKH